MTTRLVKRPKIDPQNAAKDPLARLRQNVRTPVMPVSFAAAMAAFSAEHRRNNRSRGNRLRDAWELAVSQVAGVPRAAKDADVRARDGKVTVTVDNPALAHELGVVYRAALLAKMKEIDNRDTIIALTVKARSQRRK